MTNAVGATRIGSLAVVQLGKSIFQGGKTKRSSVGEGGGVVVTEGAALMRYLFKWFGIFSVSRPAREIGKCCRTNPPNCFKRMRGMGGRAHDPLVR